MSLVEPKTIILRVCEPRKYSGEDAHSKLNSLSKALHESILKKCSFFNKTMLLEKFYNLFDESCYRVIIGNHFATKDLSVIKGVEKSPSIFRYLLEATIHCDEKNETSQISNLTEKNLLSIINGASIFFETCNFSNYLYRNDFAGGFTVNKFGELDFVSNEEIVKSEHDFVDKMNLYKSKIRSDSNRNRFVKSPKRVSLKEEAYPYDSAFMQEYGVKLSTIVDCAESIILYVCKKNYGVIAVSQSILFKKVKRKTNLGKKEIKKAIQFLEIDKHMLSKDYKYYKFYDAPISISRRPIIRLFTGSEKKGNLVYLGPNALMRSLAILFGDINRGIIKLGSVAEDWDKEKGPEFEEKIKSILVERGFKALRVTDPPSKVGEIDAVAFDERTKVLLVIEAKASKIDLSMDKAKWHFERSRKWNKKLDKKVKWAKTNSGLLLKRLDSNQKKVEKIIGLIITRVPWYVEEGLKYNVFSLEEFEVFLEKMKSSKIID